MVSLGWNKGVAVAGLEYLALDFLYILEGERIYFDSILKAGKRARIYQLLLFYGGRKWRKHDLMSCVVHSDQKNKKKPIVRDFYHAGVGTHHFSLFSVMKEVLQ